MATLAQINVRLGFLFDDKALKSVERNLRTTGQRLSAIGSEMTTAISVPLLGLGAAAIKTAGDIEGLTLALKSQLGSAGAAAKKLQLLTDAAKNPGLGVEQAVRGSVRLQGVKLSAQEARNVLVQMGNAIAATGGSAQELDNVTRQFAQMISKGRVLQEDVSILSENMPGLAQLMEKAFGTTSVEAIRDMGISGKEFVLQITRAAEALPRVEGGIKNSIGNAIDSLKQSAAQVGLAMNQAFNITGAIESVSGALLSLAQAFSSLDPETQKLILAFAGIVVATGPLLKAYGAIKLAGSQLVGNWRDMAKGISSFVTSLVGAEAALGRLKLAMGIVGVVAALGIAVYTLADNFDAASYATEVFADAQGEVLKQTKQEIGLVNQSFEALKKEGASRFDKGKIIDELNRKYPDILKNYNLEEASLSQLTQVQNKLNNEILRGVAERLKVAAVTKIYEKQAELLLRVQQIRDGASVTASEATLIDTGDMEREGTIAAAVVKELQGQIEQLGNEANNVSWQFDKTFGTYARTVDGAAQANYELRDSYYAAKEAIDLGIQSSVKDGDAVNKVTNRIQARIEAREEAKKRLKEYRDTIAEVSAEVEKARLFGEDEDIAKVDALRKAMERLIDLGFKAASKEVQALKAEFDRLTQKPADIDTSLVPALTVPTSVSSQSAAPALPTLNLKAPAEEAALVIENLSPRFQQLATDIGLSTSALMGLGDGMSAVAQMAGPAFEELAGSALGVSGAYTRMGAAALAAAAKIMKAALASTLATAIQDSFKKSGHPLLGIAVAGIAVAAVNALFGRITQSLSKVPTYAKGTPYHSGGMAIVGEQGPEMVQLPQGTRVHTNSATNRMLSNMSGSNVNVSGEFRVQGTDLVLVLERANAKNNRYR